MPLFNFRFFGWRNQKGSVEAPEDLRLAVKMSRNLKNVKIVGLDLLCENARLIAFHLVNRLGKFKIGYVSLSLLVRLLVCEWQLIGSRTPKLKINSSKELMDPKVNEPSSMLMFMLTSYCSWAKWTETGFLLHQNRKMLNEIILRFMILQYSTWMPLNLFHASCSAVLKRAPPKMSEKVRRHLRNFRHESVMHTILLCSAN